MSNTIEVTTEGDTIITVTPEGNVTVGVEYNPVAGSGADTDIGITRTNAAVTVTSSTGNDGTILAADASNAGVFTAANFTKLAAITGINTGDQDLSPLMVKANNLSDLTSVSTARTNLGLGTLATQSGTFSGTSSGTNTGDQSIFKNIAVAGQSTVVADTTNDTLTLIAGTNITLTTDALTDSVTINATSSSGDVVGPASATNGAFALFDTTTGKLLKNGSVPGGAATLNVGTSAGTVAAGDDSRFTNARTPTAHASTHITGGTDAIQSATSSQDGLATATQITKLDGIEAGADVTDATNVSAAGAVMKTLADAKGDLFAATAADTVTRLPIGATNGHVLTVDSAETTGMKWAASASSGGDVVGPASSTDNAFARFDSTTGKLLQNSTATLDDVGLASVDGVQFSATPTSTVGQAKAVWDTTNSCLKIGLNASVNALVGTDSHVQVYNESASTMTVMQVVRQSGSSGTRLSVELAMANTDANSANSIGVVVQSIASNSQGFIQTAGLLQGVNTNAFNEGDTLWLSATTAGLITNVKPTAPNHGVRIGYCIKKAGGAGIILIDILNGFELDELHDVKITAPIVNNSFLAYNTTLSVWENKVDVPASQLTGTLDLARFPAQITGRTSFDATDGATKDSSLEASNLSFTNNESGMLISIAPPDIGNQVFLTWPSATGILLTNVSSLPAANLTGTINNARLPATITGLTSVTSTTFVGALTGTASGNLPLTGGVLTGSLTVFNGTNRMVVDTIGNISFPTSSTTAPANSGIGNWVGTLALFGNGGVLAATVSNQGMNFGNTMNISFGSNVFIRGPSAATIQLGINAASGTNQTIKACDGTAGSGADLILSGGTGTTTNGNVRFGTHSAWAAEVISGYITIKDAGGTLRKLAVIS